MKFFDLGGLHVKPIQKLDTIEIFEITAESEGLGPGYHVHHKMEESFYVIEGAVLFTVSGCKQLIEEGGALSVLRDTLHRWETVGKKTKMLLIFTPAQNQLGYFTELETLYQQGFSWQESIFTLAHKFDNPPVDENSPKM